jgi:hypothetical protein
MKFMLMVRGDQTAAPPSPELIQAIGKLTEDMTKAGVLVDTGGLAPPSMGARLKLSGGKVNVTDGPFTEAKEVIGGYAIIRVGSRAEAIEHAKMFLQIHADILGPSYETETEIRQMFEPSDFGPSQNC